MGEHHEPMEAEHHRGSYRLHYACGWTSPWDASVEVIGLAFDTHRDGGASTPPGVPSMDAAMRRTSGG